MLSNGREDLYNQGRQFQQQGESEAALRCFLACLLGLTNMHSFHSLPDCLHQIAEVFIKDKNYAKALQFIQAEKMFYEVALIDLTAHQGTSGPSEVSQQGAEGWDFVDDLSEQASQARDYEKLAQLCIMSKRPHLALEYSGKATKIRQKTFGNDHPITAKSLELLASVYAEIGKKEYSDTLGQYMSALSKTFSTTDSFSDALNGVPPAKTEERSDVRLHHKKDVPSPPDVRKQKNGIPTTCTFPTSILRKKSNFSNDDKELAHRKKSDRRVHFREPEITVHDIPYYDYLLVYNNSTNRPHYALLTCLFILLSILGAVMYCTDKRRHLKVCEELESMLSVCFVQMKQVLWSCWIWLTMQ
ncbi:nutritionally-regulated adipose and cardiac enriched protein homolog isoform X1 [Lepisosteus oculatus]|uniref:nutritionally-regulated adipose and cardiac enriched protein homolog isoform X1 n=1 Tax=Lepisosteus oculatus TaxID=7918 RepID=UPI0037142B92